MQPAQVDQTVYQAVFGSDSEKQEARYQIWQAAVDKGIVLSSINDLYMARGAGKLPLNFTVPAMNLRGMAYDMARAAFRAAKELKVGALIFEIARSEIDYTDQAPAEYACVVSAAALREGWSGPLFIQGDHFQSKAASAGEPKAGEIDKIKNLIQEAVEAGFYNIDIDMSTLVDLEKPTEAEQQAPNIKYSLEIAKYVRAIEPKEVSVSLGGEIGHIGGKNSTVEDYKAYIAGFNAGLPQGMEGMSKISVQTGTSHGGVVLANGSLADVDVDFSILSSISKVCREKYQMGGTVQHGASTLPDKFFNQFTKSEAIEVHLATGFQNIQMEHEAFPKDLLEKMYAWLDAEKSDERKEGQTLEQFHYKLRKKAWGKFKKASWDIAKENKAKMRQSLYDRFKFMFTELNAVNTQEMVAKYVKTVVVKKDKADFAV